MNTNQPHSHITHEAVFDQAIDKWGETPQLMMAMEESAEFIQAVSKFLRKKEGASEHLIEEMADLQIMVEQVTNILERHGVTDVSGKIAAERQRKIARLVERLKA